MWYVPPNILMCLDSFYSLPHKNADLKQNMFGPAICISGKRCRVNWSQPRSQSRRAILVRLTSPHKLIHFYLYFQRLCEAILLLSHCRHLFTMVAIYFGFYENNSFVANGSKIVNFYHVNLYKRFRSYIYKQNIGTVKHLFRDSALLLCKQNF